MNIIVDDLSGPEVAALLEEHLRGMAADTPPESVHALDLERLKRPEITFWSAWEGRELLGCGALKDLGGGHGELKSMRTAAAHLRKGVAARILAHIAAEARRRGFERLSLETGSPDSFIPARKLYEKFGFDYCGPFADYKEDPYSVYMTMTL
ncbi:GNAT family N-acetyltransferase [Cohnella hashimotonis]|uniref:GNAT family N-acetyltransferase n=1 Tax=Cohnella hashimotonis TaxID=2826895 RepID=A0ABT6TK02_9BACL|nr:GNAT family N-acetyltransferase [Cohnella hashimotonis]MDI4647178.1 GNAT family N-acetyltransferase [Cohnella hashimotonis]